MKHLSGAQLNEEFDMMLDKAFGPVHVVGRVYSSSAAYHALDEVAYFAAFQKWREAMVQQGVIFEHADGEYYDQPQTTDERK